MQSSISSKILSLSGAAGSLKKPFSWKKIKQIAQEDRFKRTPFLREDFDKIEGITRREPSTNDYNEA